MQSLFSRVAHKIDLVPTGEGSSHLLVSVVLSWSCSFEQVSANRSKDSIWAIIIALVDTEWPIYIMAVDNIWCSAARIRRAIALPLSAFTHSYSGSRDLTSYGSLNWRLKLFPCWVLCWVDNLADREDFTLTSQQWTYSDCSPNSNSICTFGTSLPRCGYLSTLGKQRASVPLKCTKIMLASGQRLKLRGKIILNFQCLLLK